jgi:hypothetical protein
MSFPTFEAEYDDYHPCDDCGGLSNDRKMFAGVTEDLMLCRDCLETRNAEAMATPEPTDVEETVKIAPETNAELVWGRP